MPNRDSYLKARYCRAVLKTAVNSYEEDARRLVYCLATEPPTPNMSSQIAGAEDMALTALAKLARRVEERGIAALGTHWKETDDVIVQWIEAAHREEDK